jgi:hypothetical protein
MATWRGSYTFVACRRDRSIRSKPQQWHRIQKQGSIPKEAETPKHEIQLGTLPFVESAKICKLKQLGTRQGSNFGIGSVNLTEWKRVWSLQLGFQIKMPDKHPDILSTQHLDVYFVRKSV